MLRLLAQIISCTQLDKFIIVLVMKLLMKTSGDQELFKAMSNRTRTKPHQIYIKLNSHIAQLQGQVAYFNKTQQKVASSIKQHTKHGATSRDFKLKSMSQPKHQQFLLNCEISLTQKNSPKGNRLKRGTSTKTGKEFKSLGMSNSISNLSAIKSSIQSKMSMSKTLNFSAQKNNSNVLPQSSMFKKVINPIQISNFEKSPILEVTGSMTESMLIPNKSLQNFTKKRKPVKTLRQKVQQKQMQLQNQWQKTQMYRGKVSSYLGEEDLCRMQKSTFAMTRIVNVIDKIKKSRALTADISIKTVDMQSIETC